MLPFHKIPILNFGVEDEQKFVQLQRGIMNLDSVLGNITILIFLISSFFYQYPRFLILLFLVWTIINFSVLFLNKQKKTEIAVVCSLSFYIFVTCLTSILFGSSTLFHLILILCSFGAYMYEISNKWVHHLLFACSIISFMIISVCNIRPYYILDPKTLDFISMIMTIIFSITFSYKMLSLNLYQKIRTKEKVLAEDLQQRSDLLQLIINNLPQYIFWKNNEGEYIGSNNRFAQKAGFSSSNELILKKEEELLDSKEISPFLTAKKDLELNGSFSFGKEEEIIADDGTTIWFKTNRIPLIIEEEEQIGTLYTFEDISKSKIIELEKKENDERLNTIFEHSPFGIGFRQIDTNQIKAINPKLKSMLG